MMRPPLPLEALPKQTSVFVTLLKIKCIKPINSTQKIIWKSF